MGVAVVGPEVWGVRAVQRAHTHRHTTDSTNVFIVYRVHSFNALSLEAKITKTIRVLELYLKLSYHCHTQTHRQG